jgi:hypothetical protein
VAKYLVCQKVKADRHKTPGLPQPLRIGENQRKFAMNFVIGLPKASKRRDVIWVIVDTLTKVAHFIPYRYELIGEEMAHLYMIRLYTLYGIPTSIISDRDARFTS